MGAGGVTNRGVYISYERRLESEGVPNSRVDRLKNGVRVQSRWYDKDGKADRNRDYEHNDTMKSHFFPHDHLWQWRNGRAYRGKELIIPDYEKYPD